MPCTVFGGKHSQGGKDHRGVFCPFLTPAIPYFSKLFASLKKYFKSTSFLKMVAMGLYCLDTICAFFVSSKDPFVFLTENKIFIWEVESVR
jgi:hypothetical protein